MNNEEIIIGLIKDLKSDMHTRFEQVDKRFEQSDNRITDFKTDVSGRFTEQDKKFEEIKNILKEEKSRVDEIYHERKNMKISWSLPFVGFNAGISACVAFFVSLWK